MRTLSQKTDSLVRVETMLFCYFRKIILSIRSPQIQWSNGACRVFGRCGGLKQQSG